MSPPMRSVSDIDWQSWKPTEVAVLLFVIQGGRALLIHKKRGLGAGKISAPGGRIEAGETPEDAAVRETQEELGVTALAPRQRGRLRFQFVDGYALDCHVLSSDRCEGEPHETDGEQEVSPQFDVHAGVRWHTKPLGALAPDDRGYWHPRSEADIQVLVRHARARGLQVRVRGAAHSVPAAIHSDARLKSGAGSVLRADQALEMLLDLYAAVTFDDARRQVTVQAGCRFGADPHDPTGRASLAAGLLAVQGSSRPTRAAWMRRRTRSAISSTTFETSSASAMVAGV